MSKKNDPLMMVSVNGKLVMLPMSVVMEKQNKSLESNRQLVKSLRR